MVSRALQRSPRRGILGSALLLISTLLSPPVAAGPTSPGPDGGRPNILLIVADDLGSYDIGSSGNPLARTPNLDELAAQGVSFTHHYADSTCQPSRAALLTGRIASRVAQPAQFIGISPELTTLPETLRRAGYRTTHIGKWHLGDDTEAAWPNGQGFDEWFGFLSQFRLGDSESPDRVRYSYIDPWLQSNSTPRRRFHGHLTDLLTARAVETVRALKDSPQPWFLNLWYFARIRRSSRTPVLRSSTRTPGKDVISHSSVSSTMESAGF